MENKLQKKDIKTGRKMDEKLQNVIIHL